MLLIIDFILFTKKSQFLTAEIETIYFFNNDK